jgi:hypothetical protein
LSVLVIFEGRQMCSSTPMVLMPLSRSGSAILVCASALIADQQVSHATPRCRAIADTVVSSCRNASTAHDVALEVSLARGVA